MAEDTRSVMWTKGSFYVSLPASFVRHHKLVQGSEVTLYYGGRPVVLVTRKGGPVSTNDLSVDRSLQAFDKTLYFALPMVWCKRHKVVKGTDLNFEVVLGQEAVMYTL